MRTCGAALPSSGSSKAPISRRYCADSENWKDEWAGSAWNTSKGTRPGAPADRPMSVAFISKHSSFCHRPYPSARARTMSRTSSYVYFGPFARAASTTPPSNACNADQSSDALAASLSLRWSSKSVGFASLPARNNNKYDSKMSCNFWFSISPSILTLFSVYAAGNNPAASSTTRCSTTAIVPTTSLNDKPCPEVWIASRAAATSGARSRSTFVPGTALGRCAGPSRA
mmetsp:Transcript_98937/g.302473  ORF Transcript_98937/g.302473 Transcript_98937/m.302473 type:complete len:228 (-) Transcript_98937:422-1105(-)